MKRLFFHGEPLARAAEILMKYERDFDLIKYTRYPELEVVWQEDGRFSVWGNFGEETVLLRDSRKDVHGLVEQALPFSDRCEQEE